MTAPKDRELFLAGALPFLDMLSLSCLENVQPGVNRRWSNATFEKMFRHEYGSVGPSIFITNIFISCMASKPSQHMVSAKLLGRLHSTAGYYPHCTLSRWHPDMLR